MIVAQIIIKLEAPGLETALRHVGAKIIEGIRALEVRAAEQEREPVVGSSDVVATAADVAPQVITRRISRASLFTAERDELLATAWPAGIPPNEVMASINSLPGPPVTIVQIGRRAHHIGVARPIRVREVAPATQASPITSGDGMAAIPVAPLLKFSHERDACICKLWDGPLSALWSAVDRLPGPRVTADEIVDRATKALGLPPRPARSARVPASPKHSVSSPRIAVEAPAVSRESSASQTTAAVQRQPERAPDETGCVPAIFSEIAAWAAPRGLKYDGSNMDKVNRLRSLFRLPPFVQIESAAVSAQ